MVVLLQVPPHDRVLSCSGAIEEVSKLVLVFLSSDKPCGGCLSNVDSSTFRAGLAFYLVIDSFLPTFSLAFLIFSSTTVSSF